MPERGRSHNPGADAVSPDRLGAMQRRRARIIEHQTYELAPNAARALRLERLRSKTSERRALPLRVETHDGQTRTHLAANELRRVEALELREHGKTNTGLERRVGVCEVGVPVAIILLGRQAIDGAIPSVAHGRAG